MDRVLLESPYAQGDIEQNIVYARKCLADCLARGESPFASHLLYTQPGVLDDALPDERRKGIDAGHAWLGAVKRVVVYCDMGISPGMVTGIQRALRAGVPIEMRSLWNLN